jgi:hypothetical protein
MKHFLCTFCFVIAFSAITPAFRCLAGTADGYVADRFGKPIAKATVYLSEDLSYDDTTTTLTTDSSGSFSVKLADSADFRQCVIDAPGFAPSGGDLRVGTNSFTLRPVTAVPGASIVGKAVREDGTPVSGVRIEAFPHDLSSSGSFLAVTAADGNYKLTGMSAGTYNICDITPTTRLRTVDWVPPKPLLVHVTGTAPAAAPDLVLKTGMTGTGTGLDADTKNPVPGVRVTIISSIPALPPTPLFAFTAADGSFTAHLEAGHWNIKTEFLPDDYVGNQPEESVSLANSESFNLDPILLKRVPPVDGTVVNDSGKAVSGISVRAVQLDNDSIDFPLMPTDNSGHFSLYGLKAGQYWVDPGYLWTVISPKAFTVPSAAAVQLVVKKNSTTTIKGTVVDMSGKPVADVDVRYYLDYVDPTGSTRHSPAEYFTAADGSFTLTDVPTDVTLIEWQGAVKDGYLYKSGGRITSTNGNLCVAPVVMYRVGG